MAVFSSDTTPYGVLKNFTEVPFAAAAGANDTPIFVLAFKSGELPYETSAQTLNEGSSTARKIDVDAGGGNNVAAVGEDEYAGLWLEHTADIGGATEYSLIVANTAATAESAISYTLDEDKTQSILVDDTVRVTRFSGYNKAIFHTDFDSALQTYYTKDVDGAYEGTKHDAVAYDQLKLYSLNGGGPYYVIATEWDATPATLQANLAATADTDMVASLRAIRNAGIICAPKGYTGMLAANDSAVDSAWIDYCDLRATSNSEDLREHVYMMSANGSNSGAAATYISTTLNKTSERHAVCWPRVKTLRQDGLGYYVDSAGYYAALPGRVHSLAQAGVGHSIAGQQLTQAAGIVGLEVNPTKAERPTLQAQNINYMVSEPGVGTYMLGSRTGKKTKTSPVKQLHVVQTRNYAWSGLNTIAKPFVMEPNSPATRSQMKTLMEQFLRQMRDSGQINDYRVEDKTSANDVSNSIVRMRSHVLALGVTEFIELTVVSEIAESFQ